MVENSLLAETERRKLMKTLYIFLIASILLLSGCQDPIWAKEYTNEQIANAIYWAEGGAKAKVPYGILSVKVKDEAEARRVCINTIRNNRIRFTQQTKYKDFIEFLGSRYCPVSAHKLNRFWVGNVKKFLAKGVK